MTSLIDSISQAAPSPTVLTEVTALARRRADILVCFERLGSSNGPIEAVCGCDPGWSGVGWSGWMQVVSIRV
ncbi:hypothetical protein [Propionibacterium acidifaciens]|uniref:hypothetical protein n=1 Tax=Propionibacterium acidifaciens TaxID=556499 RepID=UPI003609DD8D